MTKTARVAAVSALALCAALALSLLLAAAVLGQAPAADAAQDPDPESAAVFDSLACGGLAVSYALADADGQAPAALFVTATPAASVSLTSAHLGGSDALGSFLGSGTSADGSSWCAYALACDVPDARALTVTADVHAPDGSRSEVCRLGGVGDDV